MYFFPTKMRQRCVVLSPTPNEYNMSRVLSRLKCSTTTKIMHAQGPILTGHPGSRFSSLVGVGVFFSWNALTLQHGCYARGRLGSQSCRHEHAQNMRSLALSFRERLTVPPDACTFRHLTALSDVKRNTFHPFYDSPDRNQ